MASPTTAAGVASRAPAGTGWSLLRKQDLERYGVPVAAVGVAVLLKVALASTRWIDQASPFLFFFAAVMVSAWSGGARAGLLATVLAAAASDFFFTEPLHSFGGHSRTQAVHLGQFLLEGTVISLLGGALHRARARAEALAASERDAREEAEAARRALDGAYEKQRRIAETLQRSLLRKIAPGQFEGLDAASFYEAALDEAEIGGDFFDAFALPGGQVALVVGDVSGKGLGAATRTAEVKFALRALLREDPAPCRALGRVNRLLCDPGPPERASGGDEMVRFVALSLAVVDPRSGETVVAVAGSEPPLVVRAGGAPPRAVEETKGLPLGVEESAEYASAAFTLAPGDTLLLVTDGITEARAPGPSGAAPRAAGAFLDYAGFVDLARAACGDGDGAEVAGQKILDDAKRFAGGRLRDDACIVLARRGNVRQPQSESEAGRAARSVTAGAARA